MWDLSWVFKDQPTESELCLHPSPGLQRDPEIFHFQCIFITNTADRDFFHCSEIFLFFRQLILSTPLQNHSTPEHMSGSVLANMPASPSTDSQRTLLLLLLLRPTESDPAHY